jgi:di/tricarboxylate transporter
VIEGLSAHAIAVLVLTVTAFVLFARERLPLSVTSVALIAVLAAGFHLFPYTGTGGPVRARDFLAGFGHEALIAICALMVLGRGLVVTGALEPLARSLGVLWRISRVLTLAAVLLLCLLLSGFVNDTPIVVLMTPVLLSLAARAGTSAAPLLMPMNFAVLIGGMATTIGTSTNLLVVSIARDAGAVDFGMLDFAPIVAIAAAPALLYLLFVAPWLLRRASPQQRAEVARTYDAMLLLAPGSKSEGREIRAVIEAIAPARLAGVQGEGGVWKARLPTAAVRAGDRLRLHGTLEQLREAEARLGGTLVAATPQHIVAEASAGTESGTDRQLVEMVVTVASAAAHSTLADLDLERRFNVEALGVHRRQEQPATSAGAAIHDLPLGRGDLVMVRGTAEDIDAVTRGGDLLALDGRVHLPRSSRAPYALAIMAAVVGLSVSGVLPISVAAVLGVVAMLLTRCVLVRGLGQAISTEVVLLIPASLALGHALTETGGAAWIAAWLTRGAEGLPVSLVLALLLGGMSLLTNFVSNNAAAVIGTPIAIAMARAVDAPVEPFVLAVLFGCNMCYATPIGYQTNLIVMSAAGYRFSDFLRVGLPLAVLMIGMFVWLLPRFYGF